eukprot:10349964-Lingulodinium_polyedra.AAC.1
MPASILAQRPRLHYMQRREGRGHARRHTARSADRPRRAESPGICPHASRGAAARAHPSTGLAPA